MPFVAVNPATEQIVGEFPTLSGPDLDRALARAAAASAEWRRLSFAERGRLLTNAAELLESEVPVAGALMTTEMGKTFAAAKGEAMKCASALRYAADHVEGFVAEVPVASAARRSGVRFDPIGVIFAITPWNFPFWQVVRMAAGTIMAGNVVVFKHAPNVPGAALYLEDLFRRAGVPEGVLTSVFIEVEQVEGVIADPRVAGVTITGSSRAGAAVAALAGRHLKKCVLELGGSDPFIVAASADLDLVVPQAVTARIQNNGQACIAAKRFLVVRERAEEFLDRFAAAMGQVTVGDPMDPATALGPLVSKAQLDVLDRQVAASLAEGATALVGGKPLPGPGWYYPATVLTDVPPSSPAGCEELFGPVAVVAVASDFDDALDRANDTPWGLGASVWTNDDGEIDRAIARLDAGMVFANSLVASMNELPFGGAKASGFGRELSMLGAREFTNAKSYFVA